MLADAFEKRKDRDLARKFAGLAVASGIYVYLVVSADGKAIKVGKLSVIR